ncbi:MAG: hypothetical protein QM266_08305 [Bacillota bacterium]|jgi:hypothetical protein|nr:hypothetical protein [Bacillota bacterium]
MRLHNKKVKINSNKILKDAKRSNNLFIDFVKVNSNHILTAIQDQKTPYLYTFEEDDTWLFDETDLIEV